jgi:hypothetical protein
VAAYVRKEGGERANAAWDFVAGEEKAEECHVVASRGQMTNDHKISGGREEKRQKKLWPTQAAPGRLTSRSIVRFGRRMGR